VDVGTLVLAVIAGLIPLVTTTVAAISVSKNKEGAAALRWRRRMEPVHLDLLDWSYEVQMQANREGRRHSLPPLPESLRGGWFEDDGQDENLAELKRQVRRRHEPQ
jgi:hypothetical protein